MLTFIPDLGDLLRLCPQYNAGTLVELVRGLGAREVLWLTESDPEHPARDAFGAAGIRVSVLSPDWTWAREEAARVPEFLGQYPQGRERLRAAARLEQELLEALRVPLNPQRVVSDELLSVVAKYHAGMKELLGEGPGTAHREQRLTLLREALHERDGVVLVALDDIPDLLPLGELPDLTGVQPGETSRLRALADRALRLEEGDDLDALVAALLRESGDAVTPRAELQYAAANVYLAVGDLTSARELLEGAVHAAVDHPRSLPGLALARLGQVRDAQGDRDLARRAYSAVLALSYAPEVARDVAQAGLAEPFQLALD